MLCLPLNPTPYTLIGANRLGTCGGLRLHPFQRLSQAGAVQGQQGAPHICLHTSVQPRKGAQGLACCCQPGEIGRFQGSTGWLGRRIRDVADNLTCLRAAPRPEGGVRLQAQHGAGVQDAPVALCGPVGQPDRGQRRRWHQ